jgi:3-hydroxyisobutyrate dehydrogenase-like beta-hydroxyacid dehydrogenase
MAARALPCSCAGERHDGRRAATIAIMVGGDKKVFDDALPVLQSFSANVIHMGGWAARWPLVNNMLSFCNMAARSEA